MDQSFQMAALKLGRLDCIRWNAVAGPTTGVIASLARIGWTMPNSREVVDEVGNTWSFCRDSPSAILAAGRRAVRAWRFGKVAQSFPHLVPSTCDVGGPICTEDTVIFDFSSTLSSLLKSTTSGIEGHPWDATHKAGLISAISGGQWPQARKAAVPSWHISDMNCQLCKQHVGKHHLQLRRQH